MNNLPLAAGVAGARRIEPLKVIHSPVSLTTQDRRRAYRRKRNARLTSPPFKCGPPAVEPQFINSHSSSLTDRESDFTDNSFLTSSKEGDFTDFNDSIDSVTNPEKIGIMTSTLVLSASTSESTLRKFLPRKPFKCYTQNSRPLFLLDLPTIPMLIIYFSYHHLMKMVVNFRVAS